MAPPTTVTPRPDIAALPETTPDQNPANNSTSGFDFPGRGLEAVEAIPTVDLYMKEIRLDTPASNIVSQRYPVLTIRPNGRLDSANLDLFVKQTDPAAIQPRQAAFLGN